MPDSSRYEGDRFREIEKEAQGLVAWCREFVGEVLDNNGVSLKKSGEWEEVLGDLEGALRPVEPWKPRMCVCGHDETFHSDRSPKCLYGTSSDGELRSDDPCRCIEFQKRP